MKIIPKSRQEWLGFVLLPLKAYAIIAPVLFFVSRNLSRPRHTGATEAEVYLVFGLFPCAAILLFTALVLALVGPKDTALPCLCFGVAALVIGYWLLPSLGSS
jgi:hypothetical protein